MNKATGTSSAPQADSASAHVHVWYDRYPGPRSFADNEVDQRLFFGREKEIDQLVHRVRASRLLVLFGKSGHGKTSLLQAGLYPRLRERDLLPIPVRMNQPGLSPVQVVLEAVATTCQAHGVDYEPWEPEGLWEFFKRTDLWRGDFLQTPVLVFDQFEELFTLQSESFRADVASELGQLAVPGLPQEIRQRLESGEQVSYSDTPPDVRLILSLREEYVGTLEELVIDVPAILEQRFRLMPLNAERARRAVVEPGLLDDPTVFSTQPFYYKETALDVMMKFLVNRQGEVEPFQLQILCHDVERQVARRQRAGACHVEVDDAVLGGQKGMEAVLRNFYRNALRALPWWRQRFQAGRLCEQGLLSPTGHRVSVEQSQIHRQYKVRERSLDKLIEARLIRKEARPGLEGFYYELTHDSLTQPVLRHWRARQANRWTVCLIGFLMLCLLVVWQRYIIQAAKEDIRISDACLETAVGIRPIAATQSQQFSGKVAEFMAQCRGGDKAVKYRNTPWLDWGNYWATGDVTSQAPDTITSTEAISPDERGIDGALLDLEYKRIEMIRLNLFDNSGTFETYIKGQNDKSQNHISGPDVKTWKEMRLPADHPDYVAVGGDGEQQCSGQLIRHRTVTGICNDIRNPMMGATGQLFARNVTFDTTFPRLTWNEMLKNRHGDRLGLLKPDPQLISRKLFTRQQTQPDNCNEGHGLPGHAKEAHCDYKAASFSNVLAAFWIQFMTHDWFSHLIEGHNQSQYMKVGCDDPLTGCRPGDRMEKAYVAQDGEPGTFEHKGNTYLKRAPKTFANTVTAWWDASQLYGYDATSRKRVKRDAHDPAKLAMETIGSRPGDGEKQGYLPLLQAADPMNPAWAGQEATGFPDNWTVGMSFYHNLFAREHNAFVDAFRKLASTTPEADSGLRNPANPQAMITYKDVTADELFEAARLVVAAVIAKIHTIEWMTQVLYNEPLYLIMNANWGSLSGEASRLDSPPYTFFC